MMLTGAMGQQPRIHAKFNAETYCHEGNDDWFPVVQRRNPGLVR